MRKSRKPTILAGIAVVALVGAVPCANAALASGDHQPGSHRQDSRQTTDHQTAREQTLQMPTPSIAGTITEDVATPWGLAILPNGSALVSERDTALIKHVTAAGEVTDLGAVDGVVPGSEGGLLGLAVGPDFATDRYVYAYYTAADDNRVVRMPYENGALGEQEVILSGLAKNVYHNGGRLAFGPDGMLYISTGDAGDTDLSQDPDSLNGKILRVTPEGEPAPDNPNGDEIWTMGHRNVQGLAWDDEGNMWASELGQNTWDELNMIEPGNNYGWPICEGPCDDSQYVQPKATWRTSEASPSPLAYAQNTLWMGALRGERLWGIEIAGTDVVGDPVDFFAGEQGRWRAIAPTSDGTVWVATNEPDAILELRLQ